MKTIPFFLLFSFFYSTAFGQSNSPDTAEYIKQVQSFLVFITKDSKTSKFLLSDKPVNLEKQECDFYLQIDSITFSKEEIKHIKTQINYPVLTRWTNNLIPKAKFISRETLRSIFSNPKKEWKYFYKHYGRNYVAFSEPIFLRNYTYCLFYSAQYCGGTCGGGQLRLYKKEGDTWIKIKSYCLSIS